MPCEFSHCIYNKNNKCTVETISINAYGMCEDCIIVSIPDKCLNTLKESQANELDSRWGDA